jgi:radical SAM superfamily enzyme YgiQ (UPF0313 family)
MKITFVYPDLEPQITDWHGYFYYGVAILSAVLKKEGYQTSLIHITQPVNYSDFIREIKIQGPDLIGFSSTSHMHLYVKKLASYLVKAGIEVPTIYGGIHPTIAPDEAVQIEGIDMICRGEGEGAIVELCRKLENDENPTHIQNLWVKKRDALIKNPLRPLIADLDALPFADRDIYANTQLYCEKKGIGTFMASRGCPYNCTYCCNHLLRKIYNGNNKPVRFRSVDNLIADISQTSKRFPFINKLVFDDDILFLNRSWSEEFADKYRRKINLPFECHARADITDASTIDLLKEAGCYLVKFGIESGNEKIRQKVLHRRMDNNQIKKAFALAKKAGIQTKSYNMVGMPFDTPETVLESIKLNAAMGVDYLFFTIFQPYKGTQLAQLCQELQLIDSTDLGPTFFSPSVLKLKSISPAQILMFRNYFGLLTRYYQLLQKLPPRVASKIIALSDKILAYAVSARVLNMIYPPLRFIQRNCFNSANRPGTNER